MPAASASSDACVTHSASREIGTQVSVVHRAISQDGTCTGEHGIGLHKQGFLVDEAGAGTVAMMRTLKRALDPKNIMNPGKIFELDGAPGHGVP